MYQISNIRELLTVKLSRPLIIHLFGELEHDCWKQLRKNLKSVLQNTINSVIIPIDNQNNNL